MLLFCIIWTDTLANWLMAGGTVASAIILICTLIRQKNQFLQSRFEDHFFNMVQTFNNKIEKLYYSETLNGFVESSGENVIKFFALLYLKEESEGASDKKKEDAYNEIRKTYHSVFKQLINMIVLLFDYVDKNGVKNKLIDYHEYIKLNIPEYLKFIIALYKIYSPHSLGAKRLIKEFGIISFSDFTNYIKDEAKYKEFMAKVNE